MAAWMAANGIRPDMVLCSTAVRTRQTLDLIKPTALTKGADIVFREDLYLADARHLITIAGKTDDRVAQLLMIGHDPGMHDCATALAENGDVALRRLLAQKFSTAGVAVIDFDTDRWRNMAVGAGTLRHFMAPKRLPD